VDNTGGRNRPPTSFRGVRWDNLFDDLEGQLEQELNAESGDLRAEEERLRLGRLSLRARLAGLANGRCSGGVAIVTVVLLSGESISLRPTTFGRDWLAADLVGSSPAHAQCVLPLHAIAAVVLEPSQVDRSLAAEPQATARILERIGLPFVLRDLCRRRKSLQVHTANGVLTGTIDRVGRDHVDLAVHAPGTLRRSSDVRQYRIVPLSQIQLVRLD
jgi:hypothetical protein